MDLDGVAAVQVGGRGGGVEVGVVVEAGGEAERVERVASPTPAGRRRRGRSARTTGCRCGCRAPGAGRTARTARPPTTSTGRAARRSPDPRSVSRGPRPYHSRRSHAATTSKREPMRGRSSSDRGRFSSSSTVMAASGRIRICWRWSTVSPDPGNVSRRRSVTCTEPSDWRRERTLTGSIEIRSRPSSSQDFNAPVGPVSRRRPSFSVGARQRLASTGRRQQLAAAGGHSDERGEVVVPAHHHVAHGGRGGVDHDLVDRRRLGPRRGPGPVGLGQVELLPRHPVTDGRPGLDLGDDAAQVEVGLGAHGHVDGGQVISTVASNPPGRSGRSKVPDATTSPSTRTSNSPVIHDTSRQSWRLTTTTRPRLRSLGRMRIGDPRSAYSYSAGLGVRSAQVRPLQQKVASFGSSPKWPP